MTEISRHVPAGDGPSPSLPNRITLLRLVFLPLLWAFALMGYPAALGIGLALAAATDVVDGWVARRWRLASRSGSRLDSAADHLLAASTLAWLLMLHPELVQRHGGLLAAWIALALLTLGVALARFRRPVDLHLYSAKVGVFAAYAFAVFLLVAGGLPDQAFYAVWALTLVGIVESLLVLVLRRRVDEHQGSILIRRRPGGGR